MPHSNVPILASLLRCLGCMSCVPPSHESMDWTDFNDRDSDCRLINSRRKKEHMSCAHAGWDWGPGSPFAAVCHRHKITKPCSPYAWVVVRQKVSDLFADAKLQENARIYFCVSAWLFSFGIVFLSYFASHADFCTWVSDSDRILQCQSSFSRLPITCIVLQRFVVVLSKSVSLMHQTDSPCTPLPQTHHIAFLPPSQC